MRPMTMPEGPATALRSLRLAVHPTISLRELARRTGINSGRLSIIERGVEPTPEERQAILSELTRSIAAPAAEVPTP